MPRDWSPLYTGVMSTSSSVGIVASNAILVVWFAQMGSQTAAGTMKSVKNWSAVSALKLVASRASSRLDPGPCSSCMMSFTPVYIHLRRAGRS
jgi:hypothetical protein